jgi:D-alanyl-D-alanine carboxypeptidase
MCMTGRGRASGNLFGQAVTLLLAVLLGAIIALPAQARVHHRYTGHPVRSVRHVARGTWHPARTAWHPVWRRAVRSFDNGSPTDPAKDAALILDGRTGRTLYARNAEAERHPASLTKMMTLYLLFDSLKKGQTTLNTPIYVSQHAASQYPTKLGLPAGSTLPVDIAIRAIVVLSANDIAVAVAEALGGTESHFAELMTERARELGMRNTFYHNASGLPDDRQITTAVDLGLLARHLAYDFPQYFHYFSLPGFSYRGRIHLGHDNLLGRYAGTDGIKTGYTNASGFNLVSSVVRNGAHIIGVVMGGRSAHRRDMEMVRLLDWTFGQINQQPTLVARAEVPWQTVAEASNAQPVIAGFQFGNSSSSPPAGQQYASIAPRGEMDEDAAESQPDQDEIAKLLVTAPPKPQVGVQPAPQQPPLAATTSTQGNQMTMAPAAQAPKPQTNLAAIAPPAPKLQASVAVISAPAQVKIPDVRPSPAPASIPDVRPMPRDNAAPIVVASYEPQSLPVVMPIPRSSLATDLAAIAHANVKGAAVAAPTKMNGATAAAKTAAATAKAVAHGWTIQIGAFADVPTAKAQLAAYAERSLDKLGQAERIIVPFQGEGGKTMYRARFGTFAEPEARSLCAKLLDRGQTCFPATLAH